MLYNWAGYSIGSFGFSALFGLFHPGGIVLKDEDRLIASH